MRESGGFLCGSTINGPVLSVLQFDYRFLSSWHIFALSNNLSIY